MEIGEYIDTRVLMWSTKLSAKKLRVLPTTAVSGSRDDLERKIKLKLARLLPHISMHIVCQVSIELLHCTRKIRCTYHAACKKVEYRP